MKKMIAVVVAGLFLIAAAAPADARGHGGGGRGGGFHGGRFSGHHFRGHGFRSGVVIGGGVWLGPYWYPGYDPYYPYYPYYPYAPYAPVPVAAEPQTYIEQPGPSYWYYCEAAKAYYPYVRECPAGWLTVLPQGAPEPKQ
jgi:hypothetical protein